MELVGDINEVNIVKPEQFDKIIKHELLDIENLNLEPDDFGNNKILVANKSRYNEAQRIAQKKYREKYPEKYYEQQKKVYENMKLDEERRKHFNERSKINNKKYRDKKRQEFIEGGGELKKRGRPRKIKI